jgi:transposase
VLYRGCCGLDVPAQTGVACGITDGEKQPRTFATMTADLLAVADWLTEEGCTHVASESTGVYWRPVFNLLEGQCEGILVNARHIRDRLKSWQRASGAVKLGHCEAEA